MDEKPIDVERERRVLEILDQALDTPADRRPRFLDETCGKDTEIRTRLEKLLELEGDPGEAPEPEALAALDELTGRTDPREQPEGLAAGTRLGNWKVRERIGAGGMGSIYLAERADQQYEKKVAIKVIKRGMDSEEVLRRFAIERKVLARLEHPNIASLLDSGLTDDGRPYIVMEFVPGIPIDEFCDRNSLSIHDRLQLFLQVCQAVRHAHQTLVIHRDLKPNNILVNDDGVPKLLDFGIAKVLQPELVGVTSLTLPHTPTPLTPGFASPEQLRGETLTTASDVYSMGAVLYELLTGWPVHQHATSSQGQLDQVCNTDPKPPSRALMTTFVSNVQPDAERRARSRGDTPRRLAHRLRGDLDTIVLKALAVDCTRRYTSIEAFAEDIKRHLRGLPVRARPDTWSYRTRRLVRRNAGLFAAGALLFVSMTAATVISVSFWRDAEARGREALREATRAGELNRFFDETFSAAHPEHGHDHGHEVTVREMLDAAADRIRLREFTDPELEAQLHRALANAYGCLQMEYPTEYHRRIVHEKLGAVRDPQDPELLRASVDLADILSRLSQYDECNSILDTVESSMREASDTAEIEIDVLRIRALLAQLDNDSDSALEYLGRAQQIALQQFGTASKPLLILTRARARILFDLRHIQEARETLQEAEEIARQAGYSNEVARSRDLYLLGQICEYSGDVSAAIGFSQKVLEICDRLLGEAHPQSLTHLVRYAKSLALSRTDLTEELQDRLESAPGKMGSRQTRDAGSFWNDLGRYYELTHDPEQAEKHFRRSLAIYETLGSESSIDSAILRANLGEFLISRGKLLEADEMLQHASQVLDPDDPRQFQVYAARSYALMDLGKCVQAETMARKTLAIATAKPDQGKLVLGKAQTLLGSALNRLERFEESVPLLRAALDSYAQVEHTFVGFENQTRHYLANALIGVGEYEEAEQILWSLVERMENQGRRGAWTWNSLGLIAFHQGQPDTALERFETAREDLDLEHGSMPFQACVVLNNVAAVQIALQYSEEAEETLRESIEYGLRDLPPAHPETNKAMLALINRLEQEKRLADSAEILRELVAAYREGYGGQDDRTLKVERELAKLESRL